jgi:hypothetical protein
MMWMYRRLFPIAVSGLDGATPHPPLGQLLPQGEKAMEPNVLSRRLLPLWEQVAKPDEGATGRREGVPA